MHGDVGFGIVLGGVGGALEAADAFRRPGRAIGNRREAERLMQGKELRRALQSALQGAFGSRLRGVVLYGSQARAEATVNSDVDVLVLLDEPVQLGADLDSIIHALYPLQLAVERPIHALPVGYETFEAAEFSLYRNAKREGVFL